MKKFKYLERMLRQDDDDTQKKVRQIKKAQLSWENIAGILKGEGANAILIV